MVYLVTRHTDFTEEIFTLKMVSWYVHKINLIYTHKQSVVFPVPIIVGLINSQHHDVPISYTELSNFTNFEQ
jgi:hypothetical protein